MLHLETNVLAGIGAGKLSPALRTLFVSSGIGLPERVEISVAEPNKQWDIIAMIDGVRKNFRLDAEGQKLTCHVKISPADREEADVVWKFDMMAELGVSQHNMANCSPTIWGNTLFICTSNAVDESHNHIPAPDAPSFMAMDKNNGEVLWTDNSPGQNILHGQWSSPVVGVFEGVPQVIFPGGDGWLYSFRADRWKDSKPELVWKFDANAKESKWILGGRGTRNNLIAVPVIYDGLVYVGDEDGDVAIFDLSPDSTESIDKGLSPKHEINMGNSLYQTPIVANNVLYIANKTHLFAIEANAD
ncbi:MAG: PQQ-binding-like beta-propeller repeat protein [Planctomycetota bacterium]|nr:PQQ-binding-like beta-propeller repeat protein [Planctomycetota bacterium]